MHRFPPSTCVISRYLLPCHLLQTVEVLFVHQKVTWGLFSKQKSPALLCFSSNGNCSMPLLTLVSLLSLFSSSLRPFFETFCKGSLPVGVVLRGGGHLSRCGRTETVPGTVYSCQGYIVPSQMFQISKICFPRVGKRDFHRL